jgi:hypothetical protein
MAYSNYVIPNLRKWAIILAYALLLWAYYKIFDAFFPNRQGMLGHDYSGILPWMLDSYFWNQNNPFYAIPWFSPSFCGGQPAFANAGGIYFTMQNLLVTFFDPLTSVRVTFILLAAIGTWGMHRLLRDVFATSQKAALLGGALFLFNGFYSHRMMIGHTPYQSFILIPWITWALLVPSAVVADRRLRWLEHFLRVTLAGGLLAYWVLCGFATIALAGGLTILAVAALYLVSHDRWGLFLGRSAASFAIALGLLASPILSGQAFLSFFPRNEYLLPGIQGIMKAAVILFEVLFLSPPHIEEIVTPRLANVQWHLGRHEWEFWITPVPLLLILLYLGSRLRTRSLATETKLPDAKQWVAIALLAICLIIPLAINIYTPGWNAFLKQVPFIKNSSNLVRWWIVYIPVTIIYASLALDRIGLRERYKSGVLLASLLAIVYLNAIQDRSYYHRQSYDPKAIVDAYWQTKRGEFKPEIRSIAATLSQEGKYILYPGRNDVIVRGESQLVCYNSSFGYALEYLPIKTLHPGSIYEQQNGLLNLKNPACYVFPEENHCHPGDHFLTSQIAEAQAFAQYKPFHFEFSIRQQVANWISIITMVIVLSVSVFSWAILIVAGKRQNRL